jgi:hypothetical protein
MIKG